MSDEKFWRDHVLRLETEIAHLRSVGVPKLSVFDMYNLVALHALIAGKTFHEPQEAAAIARDFADACVALRDKEPA